MFLDPPAFPDNSSDDSNTQRGNSLHLLSKIRPADISPYDWQDQPTDEDYSEASNIVLTTNSGHRNTAKTMTSGVSDVAKTICSKYLVIPKT